MQIFISEDLAVIISHCSEALLRNTWQPSVLSIETVGHFPVTCWERVKHNIINTNYSNRETISIPHRQRRVKFHRSLTSCHTTSQQLLVMASRDPHKGRHYDHRKPTALSPYPSYWPTLRGMLGEHSLGHERTATSYSRVANTSEILSLELVLFLTKELNNCYI